MYYCVDFKLNQDGGAQSLIPQGRWRTTMLCWESPMMPPEMKSRRRTPHFTGLDLAMLRRYRILALQYHPDKNQRAEDSDALFKQLNEAYTILSNGQPHEIIVTSYSVDSKRAEYDAELMGFELADDEGDSEEVVFFDWPAHQPRAAFFVDPFLSFHQAMHQFDQRFAHMNEQIFYPGPFDMGQSAEYSEPPRQRRRRQDPFDQIFGTFFHFWSQFP